MADASIRSDTDQPIGLFGLSLRNYAVYTLDATGVVTSWNPGAELISGASAAEMIGRRMDDLYTPEQRASGHPEWILQQARTLGTHVDEGWRLRKNGDRFWAHVVTTALRSTDGELRGYARLTRDDTEIHNRLQTSLRLFRDLYELTPVAIGLYDRSGHVLDCNTAMCKLLGYTKEQLRGRHVTALGAPDDPGLTALAEVFEQGTAPDEKVLEWSLIRSDGQVVICELHIARSEQFSGEPFWLVVFEDITDRRREAERLRYWATHDELTGLPNRAAIPDLLADAHPERAAVLYCDVKNFDRINESLGYTAGDDVLVAMARRLETHLPQGWSVVRATADEFAIICPDIDAYGGMEAVATTVARLMHATVPVRGQLVQVSALIGAAVAGESGGRGEDLVRLALAAMLNAKRRGHTSISLAGPTLIDSIDGRLKLESELRKAIDDDELTLFYQPVVNADGTIRAAEALVRWQHPERGLLAPDVFLPVAEQSGMMADIDAWVLRRALTEAAGWPAPPGGAPVPVSINTSQLMPGQPVFMDLLDRVVADTGIAWNRVVLELLETAIVDLPSRMYAGMCELRDRGMRFAVDDFGTGYSSLTRIRQFPAQIIKIDRTFVHDIASGTYDFVLVRTVTELARAMGCISVAEGVETREQFEMLRSLPVDAYQGWLFSKAVPGPDLVELIKAGPIRW